MGSGEWIAASGVYGALILEVKLKSDSIMKRFRIALPTEKVSPSSDGYRNRGDFDREEGDRGVVMVRG
jgi:hypothetical protein